jgi:hypothetical protein
MRRVSSRDEDGSVYRGRVVARAERLGSTDPAWTTPIEAGIMPGINV